MEEEEREYILEMHLLIPDRDPKIVKFRTKEWGHLIKVIKRVEDALMELEGEQLNPNIKVQRKAHINKLARKMAIQMIKDGGFQASLFDGDGST